MQAKGRLQCWNADGQELGGSCREGCAGKGQAATLEQQRLTARHRENRPSNSLWEPILCEGQCGQQEHAVSCAQLPGVLNCCVVLAVMWAHCGDACHALGKTMPDETLARSRQKGKEKKAMK